MVKSAFKLDNWSPLSHKKPLDGVSSGLAPTWVRDRERRRLTAYILLQSYLDNVARYHLADATPTEISERREYGDAALFIEQALAAFLGDEQTIVVDGADQVEDLDETATPEEQAEHAEAVAALDRQEWFRQWADDELFWLDCASTERDALGLGDGVISLGWDAQKRRVRVSTWDPGFYFPQVDAKASPKDYPPAVHIAYEYEEDDVNGGTRYFVRRLTWRLGAIQPRFDDEMNVLPLDADESIDEQGRIVRRYPWHSEDDDPSPVTCYYSDATWEISRLDGTKVDAFTDKNAVYARDPDNMPVSNVDLWLDYIPVLHIPNLGGIKEHFGRSLLSSVLQIFDDIASTDTDLKAAARTTGSPPLVVHSRPAGTPAPQSQSLMARARERLGFAPSSDDVGTSVTPGPGAVLDAGSGKADYLDTSKNLDALLKLLEQLLKRLSVNGRMPEEVLGRVNAAQVPSGYAMALAFGPLRSLVGQMRQIRDVKYPLLLKFVQRMAMVGYDPDKPDAPGALPPGPTLAARVQFGSYLPADLAQTIADVTTLLRAKAISRLTAVGLLIKAGMEIDDAAAEVERVEHEDFEGADQLANIDIEAARARLGLDPTNEVQPPPKIQVGA